MAASRPRIFGPTSVEPHSDDLLPRRTREKTVRVGRTHVGKGIFARRHYASGSFIGEIEGQVIHDADYGSDYCMDIGNDCVLEPSAPYRFVNHSCEPNCEFDYFDVTNPGEAAPRRRVFLLALCDIEPGEELTIDYHWSANSAIPCHCRSPYCRGWIVTANQLNDVIARSTKG